MRSGVTTVDVLVVGAGPCGLMLANELGRRGVSALVVDQKTGTAFSPQANATQARSMEHYRRLGFAAEVRALGLPDDYPTDIAYFTRYAGHELARYGLPASGSVNDLVRRMSGSWSAAELAHRVSQKFVEDVLHRHACALPGIAVRFGWRLTGFTDAGTHVDATLESAATGGVREVRAWYLVGADGARSFVRRRLGFDYAGDAGAVRDFLGGRMLALYVRMPGFYRVCPHRPAWMYWTFNRERRAVMAAVDGKGEFAFHTQLRDGEDEASLNDAAVLAMLEAAMGARVPVELLARNTWIAGRALVAERFASGRVFLGGDAVHLFTPTGGMGYNTAIEDAVNLGWKIAAVLKGVAPPALLDSYEAERRPVAVRNTGYARGLADSVGRYRPTPAIEAEGAGGEAARRRAGEYLGKHARVEFDIPGFTLGARYDGSPIVADDGTPAPPDGPSIYVPTGKPGGRSPHVWLADGRSLFDTYGFDWTLLRLGPGPSGTEDASRAFVGAASRRGVSLAVVDCEDEELHDLYECDLALVRPDQVVAWRRLGTTPGDAEAVLGHALGDG